MEFENITEEGLEVKPLPRTQVVDMVNNPPHYANSCSIECIDSMIVAFGAEAVYDFCICNAYKYIWRYKHKNGDEDLKKAEWYINKADRLFKMYSGNPEVLFSYDDNENVVLLQNLLREIKPFEF